MQAAHRVVKNTGILYARMAITVFISLYSTRLILAALGVADFGLFNLVGGVIAMLGFLNSSMAAATQRFMSFAQGAGDIEKVKRIFNMSSLLHWGIAVMVFLLLEGAGYFFFHGVLNITPNRLEDAKLIYQFMIVSTLFTVISVPYEAVITSHENMLVYAVMGVIEAVLKLGIALYITYSSIDHLVMYGLLMAALSILLLIIKRIYCHRVYKECHLHVKHYYDKPLLKEMGGFAGWSLLGSSTSMLTSYGQGVIINVFFGTVVNAAQGIATQISGQLGTFALTMQKALNPLIVKSEGEGKRGKMLSSITFGTKASFFLLVIFAIPVYIEMPFIFNLWLKNVPNYTIVFCKLLIIRNLIEQIYVTLTTAISSVGKIKELEICTAILNLCPLFVSYYFLNRNFSAYSVYIIYIIYALLFSFIVIYFSNKKCNLSYTDYIKNVILRCLLSLIVIYMFSAIPSYFMNQSFIRFLSTLVITIISIVFVVPFIGLSKSEREILYNKYILR